jgi:peptidylprolyl isomerase
MKSNKRPVKKKQNTNVRWIAGAVIVLVVIAIAWSIYSSQKPAAQSGQTPAAQSGKAPVLVGTKEYDAAPPMTIDKSKQYSATVKMAKGGEFVIQLYADKAPITVNSFVFLARQGYFDGTTFHRVLEGFMAQGGDPTGTGGGGPGYEFVNEDSDLTFDKAGVVAMANAGRDTNGSQFFITFGPTEQLNGGYTIFGQVISGMDVVNGITLRDPNKNPSFTGDVMESITISEK